MKFSDISPLTESQRLDERLGPLANLNAGNLINVFKQARTGSADQSKFVKGWGASVGQGSEQINFGAIKSWKDLRKKLGPSNDAGVVGAVFYVDGTAFAAVNFSNINLRAPTSEVGIAFDPSKLPELPTEEPPEGLSGWDLDRWKRNQAERLPGSTATTRTRYDDTVEKYTGRSVELRELERYIDRVIAQYPGHDFTVVGITADRVGAAKSQERNRAAARDDELERRTDRGYYSSSRSPALQTALDKYKASKNLNSFFDESEVLEFVADTSNIGEKFVYKDKEYLYKIPENEKISIPVKALMDNTPITFALSMRTTASNDYDSLRINYKFENGQLQPYKIGY